MKNKGFTLIELLVVISIIGLLSSIVLTSLNSAVARARDSKKIQELTMLRNKIDEYHIANNAYPMTGGHWTTAEGAIGSTCAGMVGTPVGTFDSVANTAGSPQYRDVKYSSSAQDYCYTISVGTGWQCGGVVVNGNYPYAITFKAETNLSLPALNAGVNRYCILPSR